MSAQAVVTEMQARNGHKQLKRKDFEKILEKLQGELVQLQEWVKKNRIRAVVVFEGRDAAGKGGVIKRITERLSPRVFRVVALPAPTDREKSQIFMQRYISQFPSAGEVVIFDRSWYNRALVERVMGFCTEQQARDFLRNCPTIERGVVDAGIVLIKYWFEVGQKEQTRRFLSRMHDRRKLWKLSPMDLESHRRWYDYSRARDEMFAATDTDFAPWYIVPADDKRSARLNCISHLLSRFNYEPLKRDKQKLPDRQKRKGYVEPQRRIRIIPQPY